MNKKAIIANIIKVLIDGGVKIESPYDVENWISDNMEHSKMCPFFYKNEKEINVREAIEKYLQEVWAKNKEKEAK